MFKISVEDIHQFLKLKIYGLGVLDLLIQDLVYVIGCNSNLFPFKYLRYPIRFNMEIVQS